MVDSGLGSPASAVITVFYLRGRVGGSGRGGPATTVTLYPSYIWGCVVDAGHWSLVAAVVTVTYIRGCATGTGELPDLEMDISDS